MNFDLFLTIVKMEVRLRMRRVGTAIALLLVIGITWAMVLNQKTGMSMMVVNGARTLYTSSTLALGSVALCSILIGIIGFYLVRGRVVEDIRSGIGGVIAATEVSNLQFLLARWVGGVVYLGAICLTVMITMMVRHLIDGVGPLQPLIYLQTYALLLLPLIFFTVSCAILFDSFQWLIGKFGDVAYFFVWTAIVGVVGANSAAMGVAGSPLLTFDFYGLGTSVLITHLHFHTNLVTVDGGPFNPALAPRVLPDMVWWLTPVLYRFACAAIAMLPLLPAILRFHRFSPDRIKASAANKRRSPIAVMNQLLRPLTVLVRPLFALAARMPGTAGEIVAELGLCLVSAPVSIFAVGAFSVAAWFTPTPVLGMVLAGGVAVWMILISDMATRDYQADSESLSGAVASGTTGRYSRQLGAAVLLGGLMLGGLALRSFGVQQVSLPALITGVFVLASIAIFLGRCTRTSRAFTVLALLWTYIAVQVRDIAWLDIAGFNGSANAGTIGFYSVAGIILAFMGHAYNRYQAR